MKKNELPQDASALENFTKELCYVQNEDGSYGTGLSKGWEVKKAALDNAWDDINEQVKKAALEVKNGLKSPIYYFMVKRLMTVQILAAYTGFMKFKIRRHFKPKKFNSLPDTVLQKYASVFEIKLQDLKQFKGEEE